MPGDALVLVPAVIAVGVIIRFAVIALAVIVAVGKIFGLSNIGKTAVILALKVEAGNRFFLQNGQHEFLDPIVNRACLSGAVVKACVTSRLLNGSLQNSGRIDAVPDIQHAHDQKNEDRCDEGEFNQRCACLVLS